MNFANPDRLNNARNIEVRRVPPDWHHPTDENGLFVPLKTDFNEVFYDWQISHIDGGREPGPEPDSDEFMPDWSEDEASHYQMYNYNIDFIGARAPISPPMKSLAALADWLGGQGAANHVRQATLMEAARYGSDSAIEVLLEAGADPNAVDREGWTPLLLAAKSGSERAVKALLEAGVDPNAVDREGWTPLLLAAKSGSERAVKALLEAGVDPNAVDEDGWTPLLSAADADKGSEGAVKVLLESGADPNAADKNGC